MRIFTLNSADTQIENKELETAVHKLSFTATGTMGAAAETSNPDINAHITAIIGNTKLNIFRQDGETTDPLYTDIKLADLGEISTFNEGVITIKRVWDAGTAANNTVKIEFTVEIDEETALRLDDNKGKLMVSVSEKPTNTVLTMDAIDSNQNGSRYIKFEKKFVNAGVEKDFPVSQHHAIALPFAQLSALELHYTNGKVVKLTPDEVRKLKLDDQDEVINFNGLITFGYLNWAVLEISQCHMVRVTLSSSTTFYLLKRTFA